MQYLPWLKLSYPAHLLFPPVVGEAIFVLVQVEKVFILMSLN